MRKFDLFWFFIFFMLFGKKLAQVRRLGRCPKTTAVQCFYPHAYMGLWYVFGRTPRVFEGKDPKCTQYQFSVPDEGSLAIVLNWVEKSSNKTYERRGTIPLDNSAEGETLDGKHFKILDIKYDAYSLNYQCDGSLLSRTDTVWILSRTRNLTDQNQAYLRAKMRDIGINYKEFKVIDQSECPQDWTDAILLKN